MPPGHGAHTPRVPHFDRLGSVKGLCTHARLSRAISSQLRRRRFPPLPLVNINLTPYQSSRHAPRTTRTTSTITDLHSPLSTRNSLFRQRVVGRGIGQPNMDSRDPSADIGTGAVAGTPSTRAKQPSRRVSLLTPEALARKRAQDRDSQRQTRQALVNTLIVEGRLGQ